MKNSNPPNHTTLLHSAYRAPEGFAAYPVATARASTVLSKNLAAMRNRDWRDEHQYTYGLHGTPTSFTLAARIAELEGGKHTLLTPSGLAAITLVGMALLKQGDEVLITDAAYGPNRDFALNALANWGVTVKFYDPMIGAGIAELISPHTKLIWCESPSSITFEVQDLPAIVKAAHAQNVRVALDNTWSAGLALRAFDLGIDISTQALTKYQSGGSDVLMGSVTTIDTELHQKIKMADMRLGMGVSADDCYFVLRGLETLKLRFDAHDVSARKIAHWLSQRPEIAKVLHPALPSCPGHEIWQRDFSGAGGLFSVVFDNQFCEAQTDAFVEALQLFGIGFSWGGAHSLCIPYRMAGLRTAVPWPAHQGTLVRFNIGLEDTEDLITDIEQALLLLKHVK